MFEHIKKTLVRYAHAWIFLSVLMAVFITKSNVEPSKSTFLKHFQETFRQQEISQNALLNEIHSDWNQLSSSQFSKKYLQKNNAFFVHVFRNDSLVYWNTNLLPIFQFADLHFPSAGLVALQNGWYYTKIHDDKQLTFVVSFGIQRTYPYENERLKNQFFKPFPQENAQIGMTLQDKHTIRNLKNEPVFQLELLPSIEQANGRSTLFFLVIFEVLIVWHFLRSRSRKWWWRLSLAIIAFLGWDLSYHFDWFSWMNGTELFDPHILAINERIQNIGQLFLSIFMLCIVFASLFGMHLHHRFKWLYFLFGVFIPFGLVLLPQFAILIIENTSIPLELNDILTLNQFTFYLLLLIGVGGFLYVFILNQLFKSWFKIKASIKNQALLFYLFWLLIAVFVQLYFYGNQWINFVWPFILSVIVFGIHRFLEGNWSFTTWLSIVLIFASGTALSIQREVTEKEHQERELYANELADDKDITAEIEFVNAKDKLTNEPYLKRLFNQEEQPTFNELKEALERRIFNGFWERYDIDFYFFRQDSIRKMNGFSQLNLDDLISLHGVRSEIDSSLFFIRDFTSQFCYIFKYDVRSKDGGIVQLYGTLKSKLIPEEIGFPRLLISDQANVFESLEAYSIAKYYKGRLTTNYGDYSYPIGFSSLHLKDGVKNQWFDKNGYNHYVLKHTNDDAIILSKREPSLLNNITTIAFLLIAYGSVLALIVLAFQRFEFRRQRSLTLATKIQFVMISLVVVSLLGFSIGSSRFVNDQYTDYTNDIIREKIRSVNREALLKFDDQTRKGTQWQKDDLAYQLRNWSQIFITDLNIYTTSGQLVASSRPKIYNIGLLGEQMDASAMIAMRQNKSAEFIHEEHIGDLDYLSAYMPLITRDGILLGYLNLQHFDQQNVFEAQIQRFFMAIVNVFMLLLVITIIGAVSVSNWITSPLRLIRRNFSRVELGKNNQRIVYNNNDEIGDLITEYNKKLLEIEAAANQLAQTERESAWREMAKQVAHEIKNPLTPMKLSIQQLQRVFDPNDPNAKAKIDRVSLSIIEQIDALTNIANAFSSFAKLPQPVMERLNLIELIQSVSALFHSQEQCELIAQLPTQEAWINGDKEMLLRVFNNLITNGVQAVPFDQKAKINVVATIADGLIAINIQDNGSGISAEQLSRIFEPYFTTKSTGTGLGLAMVKQIVESHNGSIKVTETSSSGTIISLVFPLLH